VLGARRGGEAREHAAHLGAGQQIDHVLHDAGVGLLLDVDAVEQRGEQVPQERVGPGDEPAGGVPVEGRGAAAGGVVHPASKQAVADRLRDGVGVGVHGQLGEDRPLQRTVGVNERVGLLPEAEGLGDDVLHQPRLAREPRGELLGRLRAPGLLQEEARQQRRTPSTPCGSTRWPST